MEIKNCQVSQEKMLHYLTHLRKMIVKHHELDNLSDFVLHDLCTGPCFQVNKAAYFVNNPDFNLVRGITGYDHHGLQKSVEDIWTYKDEFTLHMQDSSFNKKVRANRIEGSFELGKQSEKYMVDKLADYLEIDNPSYHVWNLKHSNHGLVIYESGQDDFEHAKNHALDSFYYLSFCHMY